MNSTFRHFLRKAFQALCGGVVGFLFGMSLAYVDDVGVDFFGDLDLIIACAILGALLGFFFGNRILDRYLGP